MCDLIVYLQSLAIGLLWFIGGNAAFSLNKTEQPDTVRDGFRDRVAFIILYPFRAVLHYTRWSRFRLKGEHKVDSQKPDGTDSNKVSGNGD